MDLRDAPAAHLQRLAEVLWEERHLVGELLYRLTCARLLLAADQQRFVGNAVDEIDHTTSRLREVELHREGVVHDVADALGVPVDQLTLAALAADSGEPWSRIFRDHRREFLSLAAEIEETTEANRELASQALGRVRQSIDTLSGTDPTSITYDAAGRSAPRVVVPLHLDRSL